MTWLLVMVAVYVVIGIPFARWWWRDPTDSDSIRQAQAARDCLRRIQQQTKGTR